MSSSYNIATLCSILLVVLLLQVNPSVGDPGKEPTLVLNYHNGELLKGHLAVNLLWYGTFTPNQRSIIVDFINSLASTKETIIPPSAATWWKTTENYKELGSSTPVEGKQILLQDYSLGKNLTNTNLLALASKLNDVASINIILTDKDVSVEGFCSRCGTHGFTQLGKNRIPYIWVGNSETQCPSQCAYPFQKPIYGPPTAPLVAPNGDVGIDGMVINLATLLAGAVTNPFNDGYYQGPTKAPLYEAVSACTGIFGSGAYPGYPGRVLTDKTTGASYNVHGVHGRRYLLPAMWDPKSLACKTLV
ncbi:hypothetical protein RIF29_41608 [Crotalaria pallida]|uniref:Uncharacterized protein n=1 Tax=Crotalaria pallida TaxID=3830 RepID=A0AAN9HVH1_CROPI